MKTHPATKATYFHHYDESHPGNPHRPMISMCGKWVRRYDWDEVGNSIRNTRHEYYSAEGYEQGHNPVACVEK